MAIKTINVKFEVDEEKLKQSTDEKDFSKAVDSVLYWINETNDCGFSVNSWEV